MTENADAIMARHRAAQSALREQASAASSYIGRMLNMQGMIDPEERTELEAAQATIERFTR